VSVTEKIWCDNGERNQMNMNNSMNRNAEDIIIEGMDKINKIKIRELLENKKGLHIDTMELFLFFQRCDR